MHALEWRSVLCFSPLSQCDKCQIDFETVCTRTVNNGKSHRINHIHCCTGGWRHQSQVARSFLFARSISMPNCGCKHTPKNKKTNNQLTDCQQTEIRSRVQRITFLLTREIKLIIAPMAKTKYRHFNTMQHAIWLGENWPCKGSQLNKLTAQLTHFNGDEIQKWKWSHQMKWK